MLVVSTVQEERPGLRIKNLNSQENLLLLCPNHHTVVDKQFETYPAEMLKQWKRDHEAEAMDESALRHRLR